MRENKEEMKTPLSKIEHEFLDLIMTDPHIVFKTLNEREIMKPLAYKDLIENGGKQSIRGIARKYKLTFSKARTLIKNIKKNISKKW